jgi:Flp pilus assembly protein TadD
VDELHASYQVNSDLAGAHLMLGVLAERSDRTQAAIEHYQTAIHVQPEVAGPRSNLAQLMERLGDGDAARRWRSEELPLLRRDAELAPDHAPTQYRYGLSLYLDEQSTEAARVLRKAVLLEPDNADYRLALALLDERLGHRAAALEGIRAVRRLRPNDPQLVPIEQRLEAQTPP